MNRIKTLSLFSGCGGMDLGFEGDFNVLRKSVNEKVHPEWLNPNPTNNWSLLPRTNFEVVFANDILPAAKAAWEPFFYKRNGYTKEFRTESIVDLVKANEDNAIFPKTDLVIGGFPCQDFSVAGKRKGFGSDKAHHGKHLGLTDNPTEENRGRLYMWMRKVIESTMPKAFVAENVKGLVSLANIKSIIEDDFKNIGDGYIVVEARVLKAQKYGVPQSRERVFFIGFNKRFLKKMATVELSKEFINKKYDPYPIETHGEDNLYQELSPYVNVGDSFVGLDEPHDSRDLSQQSYSKAKWYGKHCQGQTEINLQGLGPTIRAEHHGNIEFRRLSAKCGGKYKSELQNGLMERRLTVRECARIQTFPDEFEFVRNTNGATQKLTPSDGYRVLGNAVPPLLAYHIAWRLQEIWPLIFRK